MATPAFAQDASAPMVRATDSKGLLAVLKQAGYKAEAKPRKGAEGTGSIEIETRDGAVYVMLSDCDEAIPDLCDTLVLSTSWDRTTPISDSQIADANRTFRYVSVWRDDEGDPVMQWAILTAEAGLAPPLFLNALQRYLDIVRDFDAVAFEGDADNKAAEPAEPEADAAPAT